MTEQNHTEALEWSSALLLGIPGKHGHPSLTTNGGASTGGRGGSKGWIQEVRICSYPKKTENRMGVRGSGPGKPCWKSKAEEPIDTCWYCPYSLKADMWWGRVRKTEDTQNVAGNESVLGKSCETLTTRSECHWEETCRRASMRKRMLQGGCSLDLQRYS